MIAIAIFYIIIIGFLFLMMHLIQKYFETYSNVYNAEINSAIEIKNQMHSKIKKNTDIQKEINRVIQNRLTEFEHKFPSIPNENEIPALFLEQTKKAIITSLHLIKMK